MPRNGSGNYSLPPVYLATPGTTVRSEQHNIPLQDIGQALSDSLPRNGSAPMTGNLAMGGRRITGLGVGTAAGDAVRRDQAILTADTQPFGRSLLNTASTAAALTLLNAVPAGRFFATGPTSGLSGGGDMTDNRSLSVVFATNPQALAGTSETVVMNPLRTAQATAASINTALAGTVLSGGAGMVTAIGDLTASRSIAMGTPSSITATSTNSTTGTSHTHALPESAVRTLIADGTVGAVGTYALLTMPGNGAIRAPGFTTAGGNLEYANADGGGNGSPAGTWRLMGTIGTATATQRTSLWLRIS